jgi:hypothetical protein
MASHVGVGYVCAWIGVEGSTGMKRGGRQGQQTKKSWRPWWKRDRGWCLCESRQEQRLDLSLNFFGTATSPDDRMRTQASQTNISTARLGGEAKLSVFRRGGTDRVEVHARDAVMSLMTWTCLGPSRARNLASCRLIETSIVAYFA